MINIPNFFSHSFFNVKYNNMSSKIVIIYNVILLVKDSFRKLSTPIKVGMHKEIKWCYDG